MTDNDTSARAFAPQLRDLPRALALLTRLPLPGAAFPPNDTRPGAYAAWAYPLVGLVVGVLATLAATLSLWLGLTPGIAALLVLLASALCTGAMHEDGLADCADGFWGGWTRERRLAIMKDSQIGTYGVLALGINFGLRWIALSAIIVLPGWALVVIGVAMASRGMMSVVMYALPNARENGLSRQTGRPPQGATYLAGGLALVGCAIALPANAVLLMLAACLAALCVALVAKVKIKGQTGDVLGATQQIVETILLLTCLAVLT
ncbi:MAG: adenosylcobinamide-GDP ribazoletransferase [Sulfitobacter sp.]